MKLKHQQEKEQFQKLFAEERIDHFDERFKILEIFLNTEKHVTVDEFVQLLEADGLQPKVDFVHDTLELMCRFGFAQKVRFDNGHIRYEHRHLGQHHDHMICTKCKKIIEFNDAQLENLQVQIAATYGFHMLQHKMEIYGICSDCLQKRTPSMPLGMARQGERLVIKSYTGGKNSRMRLLSMGLRPGDEIEVITNIGRGQMVVSADCRRFVLGRGLAQKIMVRPVAQNPLGEPSNTPESENHATQ